MPLMVHPMLDADQMQGWWKSIRRQGQKSLDIKLDIESNSNLGILEYHIHNALGEEITPD